MQIVCKYVFNIINITNIYLYFWTDISVFSKALLMATASPLREDKYEFELSRVREKIKTKFVELIDCSLFRL